SPPSNGLAVRPYSHYKLKDIKGVSPMTQKLNSLRLASKGFLIASLMAVTWIGQVEAIEGKPFKFEILPSDKCVLQKVPEVDTQLKCINLKSTVPVGPPINPTKPGDPRPENQQPKSMPTSPSEMQTVLDWCKKKSGAWTPDGRNGGTCRFPSVNSDSTIFDRRGNKKTKNDCETGGGVWDGGDGKGGCTGPLKGSKK
ncbi:MAG: hypothetical protein ACYC42_10080, partial [Lysobacter sp.]